MKKLKNSLLILSSLFILSSCEDIIELELDNGKNQLVVDGFLTNDSTLQTIRLTESSPYFANVPNPSINNAKVSITGPNNIEYLFVNDSEGNFNYDPNTLGAINETNFKYRLNIEYNSKNYIAYQTLKPSPVIDSMTYSFEEETFATEEGYYTQFFATDFAGTNDLYWIRPKKNQEPLYEDLTFIILSEDAAFQGDFADGQVFILPLRAVITDEEFPFEIGDTSSVELWSLNRNTFDFLTQVINSTGNDGLFAIPPANYKTNILNEAGDVQDDVLGIFSLSSVSRSSVIIE